MYGEQRLKFVTVGKEAAAPHPGEIAIKRAQQRAFYEVAALYAGHSEELMALISEKIREDTFVGDNAYTLLEDAAPGMSRKVGERMDELIAESAELHSAHGSL